MTEILEGYQCMGCGRIDVPGECIGVCQDRKIQVVAAGEYYAALERAQAAEREAERLRAFVRRVAHLRPAPGRCGDNVAALRARASALLRELGIGRGATPPRGTGIRGGSSSGDS